MKFDLNDIDATAFFTGAFAALTALHNKLTQEDRNLLEGDIGGKSGEEKMTKIELQINESLIYTRSIIVKFNETNADSIIEILNEVEKNSTTFKDIIIGFQSLGVGVEITDYENFTTTPHKSEVKVVGSALREFKMD